MSTRKKTSADLSPPDDSEPGDALTVHIADRLRLERTGRGWSLDDLAERSGVSKAMLSKIERAASSPTAALLGRITGALGISLSELVAQSPRATGRICRLGDQPTWRDPQTGYDRRLVNPMPGAPMQLVDVTLPPGAAVSFPKFTYAHHDHLLWVLTGTLHFQEGEQLQVLQAGDSLLFGEASDVTYRNASGQPVRYAVMLWHKNRGHAL